jgi:ATP-dependent Clp protease ATP-binding subunit ClpC
MDPSLTGRADRALALARDEAGRLRHEYIGTEHILLGLAREADGIVAQVLGSFGLGLDRIREEVIRIVAIGPEGASPGDRGRTPRARRAIQSARDEAAQDGDPLADAEYLLMGIARDPQCVAAQVLHDLGAHPEEVRAALRRLLLDRE